jgi:hypothetical protein
MTYHLYKAGVKSNVDIVLGDYSILNVGFYNVVIVYLSRVGHEMLKQKLCAECSPHSIIISVGVSCTKT